MLNDEQKRKLLISIEAYFAAGDPANALECGSAFHELVSEERDQLLQIEAKLEDVSYFVGMINMLKKPLEMYLRYIERRNSELIEFIKRNQIPQLNKEKCH